MLAPSTYVTTSGDHMLHQHFGILAFDIQHFSFPVVKSYLDAPCHDPRNFEKKKKKGA
jgi:hypothetical protein